ncbi:hypothetical protein Tco_0716656 [Tanacetum coccineum]
MKENKGIMQTKVKLTLEQSQQGVSDDVLNIRVILFSIHSDDGNPSSVNIEQHSGRNYALSWKSCQGGSSKLNLPDRRYKHRCCSLTLVKSDLLPHAHTQALKVNHSTSRLLLLNKNVISQKA